MRGEKKKPSGGQEWRAMQRRPFFVIHGPVLHRAFFLQSQRTQASFRLSYLWFLALSALILALVIITKRAQGRSFLGRPIWLKHKRPTGEKGSDTLLIVRAASEMFSETMWLKTENLGKVEGKMLSCTKHLQRRHPHAFADKHLRLDALEIRSDVYILQLIQLAVVLDIPILLPSSWSETWQPLLVLSVPTCEWNRQYDI